MNGDYVTVEMFKEMMVFLVEKFEKIDARFEQIDARFEQIDARFEKIDARFEQVDERFNDERNINRELNEILRQDMNAQFQEVFARLDRLESDVSDIKEFIVPKHADEIMTLHAIKMDKPEFANSTR